MTDQGQPQQSQQLPQMQNRRTLPNIKIFADGADPNLIEEFSSHDFIHGFTTNPSLMRKAQIKDYKEFATALCKKIEKPLSFEVFSDDIAGMQREAFEIASWGPQVYVKIPITNTRGEPTTRLIEILLKEKIAVNVTAVLTLQQAFQALEALQSDTRSILSVFAGRIADSGRDPIPMMAACATMAQSLAPHCEVLWASTRELFNVVQAADAGCSIITVPPDLLKKLTLWHCDLTELSLETVRTFYRDAQSAGYRL